MDPAASLIVLSQGNDCRLSPNRLRCALRNLMAVRAAIRSDDRKGYIGILRDTVWQRRAALGHGFVPNGRDSRFSALRIAIAAPKDRHDVEKRFHQNSPFASKIDEASGLFHGALSDGLDRAYVSGTDAAR